MLIEHSFVTTMPAKDVMVTASEFLSNGGFESETSSAFRLQETDWTQLLMKRGKKKSARAKDPSECPQRIAMQWDRGRVTVAAVIEPRSQQRSFFAGGVFGLAIAASRKSSRKTKDYSDLMILITQALHDLLGKRETPEIARQPWYEFQAALKEKARRARIRSWIFAGVFVLLMAALVTFAVMASSHR